LKSLILLWEKVAIELATRCGTKHQPADIKTISRRSKHEGQSFLMITLPNLGKDFERSLDQGYWTPSHSSFHLNGRLPRFLGGFVELVFDRATGVLLDTPSVDAIHAVRQLTLMFGKTHLPCSNARRDEAMRTYIECEKDVQLADVRRSPIDLAAFRRVSSLLFDSTFTKIDRDIYEGKAVPKHGPGATADRLRGNAKYLQSTWTARLDKEFPVLEFLFPSPSYYDELNEIDILEPEAEIPVRVISVPKTLKTPRIIGIEPTAMQYAQQSLLPIMLDGLKGNHILNSFLGFDDQEPNQLMAQRGSLYGDLATLDLSEASDRVSNQLVRELFRNHPHLRNAVDACRSTRADVPGHGVHCLSKFASMGSALCFPIEAMIFLVMVFVGIEKASNTPLDRRSIKKYCGAVRIYGDDIIVPVDCVESVVTSLHLFGAKVGMHKSFWTGRFRESCGKEYYAGHDVSIVKVRQNFPTRRRDVTEIISLVSLRNQLYFAGFWNTCGWLDDSIRKLLKYFPVVEPTSSVLGRHSFLPYQGERNDAFLHSPRVRGYRVSAITSSDMLDGYGALLKYFLKHGLTDQEHNPVDPKGPSWFDILFPESADRDHLTRSVRDQAVRISLGWAQPY